MQMEIWRHYPVGNKVDLVERLLERGVLTDETRRITRNRQPGRCCVEGCQVPPAPQMVALPPPPSARKAPDAVRPVKRSA
jgi:4-hydroxybutyryl-CoA dehydratase/vinylacetyl-CoA-Delta-isomerase